MKDFVVVDFDSLKCGTELARLRSILDANEELSETEDLEPLFRACVQLTALLGVCVPDIGPADRVAFQFPISNDFVADIVIGNARRRTYCAIKLEDGRKNSVFSKGQECP